MSSKIDTVPRTSFRLPFGLGFDEALKADAYDTENIVIGRTTWQAEPSALYLGKLAEFQQMRRNVWLDCHGAHAVYVVGKRRSGKSYTIGALSEGLVANNWIRLGQADQAVLLIDTLNIFGTLHVAADAASEDLIVGQWQLPRQIPRVRYIAPECTRPMIAAESLRLTIDPTWLTLEDWCAFFDIDPFADPLGHLLGAVLELTRHREMGRDRGGAERSGIGVMLQVLDEEPDARRFEESTREALRRRLLAVERLGFLARPSPAVESLLTPGTITVCQLRDLDERLRALIVAVLLREIMRCRARADSSARLVAARNRLGRGGDGQLLERFPRCWIILDEAHNYLPANRSLPSRPVLRQLITEGRNIGLSVVVATQQPSGLDSSIRRNADVLLVHSMSMRDDIAAAEAMLNAQVPDTASWGAGEKASGRVFERMVRALPQGYCLVASDSANRIFGIRIRPRITMHGGESY